MKIGIVGCSINGSYLAWKLSKKHDVTVFEKNKTLGEKPCSGLISERIWNFIPRNEKLVENLIDEAFVHFPRKKVKLKFHPRMLVINRRLLDQNVAKLAEENGAKLLLNTEAKKIYFLRGKKPQILADKVYEFDYLIGCDGFNSVVRKSVGIKEPKYKLGIYTHKNKKDSSNAVNIFPSRNGFAWIIPRGSNIEYGILEDAGKAKDVFDKFCRLRKIKPQEIYSHVIPEGLAKAEAGRVALCGDAIGLTKPTSYGGIIWGLTACNILLKNFPNFIMYNERLKKFFEPKLLFLNIGSKLSRILGNNFPYFLPREIYFDSDLLY